MISFISNLQEKDINIGTYAAVQFDEETKNYISEYINNNNIPNAINKDELHTTLLYSKKYLPNYEPAGTYKNPIIGYPKNLTVWTSRENQKPILVIILDCPELINRHKQLMKEHDAIYDFVDYNPHITLSYDIEDINIGELSNIKDCLPYIKITKEFSKILQD